MHQTQQMVSGDKADWDNVPDLKAPVRPVVLTCLIPAVRLSVVLRAQCSPLILRHTLNAAPESSNSMLMSCSQILHPRIGSQESHQAGSMKHPLQPFLLKFFLLFGFGGQGLPM
jgi:hypothetical protein